MKSFFKKLSLVLAAAMVITMLPLQGAKAATAITVGLSGDSKNPNPSAVTLNVGDTQSWKFTGVDKYNAAGAATKKWNSSDPTVVSVNNGAIKALKAGTAKITLQLTNNGIQYAGTTTVTVVDPKAAGTGKIKQTAYDTIVITFDTEEEAKAAKDTVKIERVKISGKGKPFYLNVGSKPTVKDNTIVVNKLAKDVTYQVTVNGKAENITLTYGDPAYVVLSYADAYIGAGYDLLGNKITAPTTTPELKVYDENDIELERTGTVKYSYDKNKSYKVTFTSGKVKFQDVNSYATVKAVYTYKVGTVNKTLEDEVRIAPVEYVAPNLGGFVESITLTDKKGDKVVYPSDYNFSAELNIKQTLEIAYFFQDQNGKKYCGKEVAGTVAYTNGIAELGSKEEYYFRKDDADATCVSLGTKGSNKVTVMGWNEGTERICLYKKLGSTPKPETDILVGVIDITVNEEAKTDSFGLEEDSFELYRGSLIPEYQKKEIKFALKDQYGEEIKSKVKVTDENGNAVDWITSDAADTAKAEGKITVHMDRVTADIEGKTIKLVSGDGYEETITVSVLSLDTAKGVRDYSVEAKPYNLTNAVVASTTLNDQVGAAITVVENIDGYPYQHKDFRVVSNADFDGAPTGAADRFYVVILNSDDQVVTKHRADGVAAVIPTSGQNPAATNNFLFDGFTTSAGVTSSLSEMLTTGNFTAVLYKTDSTTAGDFSTQSSVEFELVNKANLVSSFDTFYKLEAKDDKVVQVKSNGNLVQAVDVSARTATSDAQYETLITAIVKQMYGWFDANADGKAQTEEVKTLENLFGATFAVSDMKYVKGAEDDEVYVKSVKISYKPLTAGNTPIVEQVITINKKYDFTKSN